MKFTWKESRTYPADAQAVGGELEKLRIASGGVLIPSAVVGRASNRKNVLHPLFEWDDKIAGVKFRKHQARLIIRALVIHVSEDEGLPPTGYVNVRIETEDGGIEQYYMTAVDAVTGKATREYILGQALRMADLFREKYRHLKELSEIIDAIENTLKD